MLHRVATVATYKCTEREDPGSVVTDSTVFISSDLQHDHHAVQHFIGKALELLLSKDVMFNRVIQFSDGASTQYKNRICFGDCSPSVEDHGI